jgi:hypothetical protein
MPAIIEKPALRSASSKNGGAPGAVVIAKMIAVVGGMTSATPTT